MGVNLELNFLFAASFELLVTRFPCLGAPWAKSPVPMELCDAKRSSNDAALSHLVCSFDVPAQSVWQREATGISGFGLLPTERAFSAIFRLQLLEPRQGFGQADQLLRDLVDPMMCVLEANAIQVTAKDVLRVLRNHLKHSVPGQVQLALKFLHLPILQRRH